jgi:hypothetical protein
MAKTPKTEKQSRKNIGATIDEELWAEIKIQAIRERRKVGEVLDDAIRCYLDRIKEEKNG